MRTLAFKPRQTGRTTTLARLISDEMALHEGPIYIVSCMFEVSYRIKKLVTQLNGESSRIRPIGLDSLNTLQGVDPRNIYFDHTAYEYSNRRQLEEIHLIEDRKSEYIWGNR